MTIYLDCNATTPIEQKAAEAIKFYTEQEFGNSGSRTHEFGTRAKKAVLKARQGVASVIPGIDESDIIFTSGATESNNISILGLLRWAKDNNKKHIVTTEIEHKAVLEPIDFAESQGVRVSRIKPDESGAVSAEEVISKVNADTFLVSVMHVNNETGIVQPIDTVAEGLPDSGCYFHVDAAQGFGKEFEIISHPRIDMISVSGHKIYGPKGVGALILRRRKFKRAPLAPLMYGGGQERGLRPGTIPVPLVAGLGVAAELCKRDNAKRIQFNKSMRSELFLALEGIKYDVNGNEAVALPQVVNLSFAGIDSEAVMLALKGIVAISNGSACTSQSYQPSHVLEAMGLSRDRVESAVRLSWCHMTPEVDWKAFRESLDGLL